MNEAPKIPELHVERLALGELSSGERAAIEGRLGDEAESRLAAIAASNAEILAAHPPARVRAEVERRATPRPAQRIAWLASPVLAVAVAAIVLWPEAPVEDPMIADAEPVMITTVAAEPGDTRAKGLEPHLLLHRQEGETTVPLEPAAEARARDRLQLSYVAAGAAHGVVLSIDGGGVVTLHWPERPDGSTALQQDGAVALPQSYELDAAPEFERFILVTADEPIDPSKVLAAARKLAGTRAAASAPLPLPERQRQRSFLIRKVAP